MNIMNRKLYIILCTLYMVPLSLFADITGLVLDENNEPVIGASILIEGTTVGTITDYDGNFTIDAEVGKTLIISYVGYTTQHIAAKANMQIVLVPDTKALEEVVVLCRGDGQFLFQGDRLAGLHGLVPEHGAQGRIGHGHVGQVKLAGVLQGQRQFDSVAGSAALLVRLQRGGQINLAVFDGVALHLLGEGLSAGLVGDGGVAGQILRVSKFNTKARALAPGV